MRLTEKTLLDCLDREQGCIHIPLKEVTLPTLANSAVSQITQDHLDIRMQNYFPYSLTKMETKGDDLIVTFTFTSTFLDGDSVYKGHEMSPHGKYTILVKFLGGALVVNDLPPMEFMREPAIIDMVHDSDVQFYSNDPSFYYQGFWEDLAQVNMAIYPFPGPKGTGVWRNRHAASGGLQNPMVRVTKHIAQLAEHWEDVAKAINGAL